MSEYKWPILNDPVRRGPFPMMATINAELREPQQQLANYRITTDLGAHALVPLFIELHVNSLDKENIPEMFGKAYDAPNAPLVQDLQGRGAERWPGLLFILPTPLKMGITAVAIRQRARQNNFSVRLEWHMDRLELLATDPQSLQEQVPGAFSWASGVSALKEHPDDPTTRVHMRDVGDIVTVIPQLTLDKDIQAQFEASIERKQSVLPESSDKRKELVPGIIEVYQHDGVTVRSNLDQLIGYDFAVVAHQLGLSASVGKATFTRFLRHTGNHELEQLGKHVGAEKLEKRTRRLYNAIEVVARRTGDDMLCDRDGRRYRYQIALDYDIARDLALALIAGHFRLPGIGPSSIAVLRNMFDSFDEK